MEEKTCVELIFTLYSVSPWWAWTDCCGLHREGWKRLLVILHLNRCGTGREEDKV